MSPVCRTVQFTVSGRVQGVFFRASAKQQADLYGVRGWVRNRRDGKVEGVATAQPAILDLFLGWLQQGPELARVLKVETRELDLQEFDVFEIR